MTRIKVSRLVSTFLFSDEIGSLNARTRSAQATTVARSFTRSLSLGLIAMLMQAQEKNKLCLWCFHI